MNSICYSLMKFISSIISVSIIMTIISNRVYKCYNDTVYIQHNCTTNTYTHIHIHKQTYIFAHNRIHIYINIYVYMCIHINTHMYNNINSHTHSLTHAYAHTHIRKCIFYKSSKLDDISIISIV